MVFPIENSTRQFLLNGEPIYATVVVNSNMTTFSER